MRAIRIFLTLSFIFVIVVSLSSQTYEYYRLDITGITPNLSLGYSATANGDGDVIMAVGTEDVPYLAKLNMDHSIDGFKTTIQGPDKPSNPMYLTLNYIESNGLYIGYLRTVSGTPPYLGGLLTFDKELEVVDQHMSADLARQPHFQSLIGNDLLVEKSGIFVLVGERSIHKYSSDLDFEWSVTFQGKNAFNSNYGLYEWDGDEVAIIDSDTIYVLNSFGTNGYELALDSLNTIFSVRCKGEVYLGLNSKKDHADHFYLAQIAGDDIILNKVEIPGEDIAIGRSLSYDGPQVISDSTFYTMVGWQTDASGIYILVYNYREDKVENVFELPLFIWNTYHSGDKFIFNSYFNSEYGFGVFKEDNRYPCETREVCWRQSDAGTLAFDTVSTSIEQREPDHIANFAIGFEEVNFNLEERCREVKVSEPDFELVNGKFCIDENIEIVATSVDKPGHSLWRLTDAKGTVIKRIEGDEDVYFDSDDLDTGKYFIEHVLYHLGCRSSARDSFFLSGVSNPSISGPDTLCPGEKTALHFQTEGITWPDFLEWYKGQSALGIHDTALAVDKGGSYGVVFQKAWCTDTVFHLLEMGQEAQNVQIEGEESGCEEDGVGLSVSPETNIEGPVQYEWSTGEEGQSIHVHQSGTYFVEAHQECGVSSDSINVELEDCTRNHYIPNVFTPDGDDVNDVWHPMPREGWTFYIEIFNRRGSRVYECRGTDCAWDGIFEGEPVLPGVYVYRIEAIHEDGTEREYSGDVTLVR